jgi:glycosyltransferase involved in cell wall biosynthesis
MTIAESNKLACTGREQRVAIVHDWLPLVGGAEKVLEQILAVYPEADVFTLFDFVSRTDAPFLTGRKVTTSILQKLPKAKHYYRYLLPVLPLAIEQFDLSNYELVISSSSAVAKGVITSPDQTHVCYCHSPMRYAWDMQSQYLQQAGLEFGIKSAYLRYVLHKIRMWDATSSTRVDAFIASSEHVRGRIRKSYRRDSTVINPPVGTQRFELQEAKEDFYLAASRQVSYKRIDLIIEAFNQCPDKQLVVIGDGPEHKKLKALAGPNVHMLGYQADDVMVDYMRRAKAFVFAAYEDFGIIPLEAQACGTPVIAYKRGGARETVINNETGVLFDEQTTFSLLQAIQHFEQMQHTFSPSMIRDLTIPYSDAHFRERLKLFIDNEIHLHRESLSERQTPNANCTDPLSYASNGTGKQRYEEASLN